MMYLFSDVGTKLVESLCFTKTLFAFDFDGTLSKIVTDPDKATVNRSTSELLYQLNDLSPTAVISGRGLHDLKKKFDRSITYLVGNHGLEGIFGRTVNSEGFEKTCQLWKKQFEKVLGKNSFSGIEIEDKKYSLAIHYRKSRQRKLAKSFILESIGNLEPLARVILGKCVVNLVPAGGPHKGVALLELMLKSDTKTAFYIGDDDTDEDIFSLHDPRIFTVRVGKKHSSNAKFYLQRQSQINSLLKMIITFLKRSPKGKEKALGVNRSLRY